jgi:metal-responsive CopG/Arc/MetJ family transcriptional regulator
MTTTLKSKKRKKDSRMPVAVARRNRSVAVRRERVLVEFPKALLQRTDQVAEEMEKNRSELIRTAVEQLLDAQEKLKFEAELAAGYAANAEMNLKLAGEFSFVDHEGF